MGIQYHAEKEDLERAGWTLSEIQESLPVFDDYGEETGLYEEFPVLVAEKMVGSLLVIPLTVCA